MAFAFLYSVRWALRGVSLFVVVMEKWASGEDDYTQLDLLGACLNGSGLEFCMANYSVLYLPILVCA